MALDLNRRRAFVVRYGFLGLLGAAFVIAAAGFALFGCQCAPPIGASRDIDGMVANPKDPYMQKVKPLPIFDTLTKY